VLKIAPAVIKIKRDKQLTPTEEDFLDALNRRCKASSYRSSPSRSREKKMLWVLHEAIHDLELKALKQSHVIAL